MKKTLLLALAIVMCSSLAFAQGGNIDPYWDAAGTQCYATPAFGLFYTYVYHEGVPAANASQWILQLNGWIDPLIGFTTAPYLNILSQPLGAPPLNSPVGGISIAYGNPACEPLPALICTVTWFYQALSPLCSGVSIVADPLASIPSIEVRDCNNQAVPGGGGSAYAGTAACGGCAPPVPTTEQTWGQIKSLYN